jgi:hypothetical protein
MTGKLGTPIYGNWKVEKGLRMFLQEHNSTMVSLEALPWWQLKYGEHARLKVPLTSKDILTNRH